MPAPSPHDRSNTLGLRARRSRVAAPARPVCPPLKGPLDPRQREASCRRTGRRSRSGSSPLRSYPSPRSHRTVWKAQRGCFSKLSPSCNTRFLGSKIDGTAPFIAAPQTMASLSGHCRRRRSRTSSQRPDTPRSLPGQALPTRAPIGRRQRSPFPASPASRPAWPRIGGAAAPL